MNHHHHQRQKYYKHALRIRVCVCTCLTWHVMCSMVCLLHLYVVIHLPLSLFIITNVFIFCKISDGIPFHLHSSNNSDMCNRKAGEFVSFFIFYCPFVHINIYKIPSYTENNIFKPKGYSIENRVHNTICTIHFMLHTANYLIITNKMFFTLCATCYLLLKLKERIIHNASATPANTRKYNSIRVHAPYTATWNMHTNRKPIYEYMAL